MNLHDPTTLNRQGNDTGTQYRSIIMYGNQEQYEIAKKVIEDVQKNYKSKIVTELKKAGEFYIAEDYHMNYYNFNENQGYCRIVIRPKIKKLESLYS